MSFVSEPTDVFKNLVTGLGEYNLLDQVMERELKYLGISEQDLAGFPEVYLYDKLDEDTRRKVSFIDDDFYMFPIYESEDEIGGRPKVVCSCIVEGKNVSHMEIARIFDNGESFSMNYNPDTREIIGVETEI